MFGKQGVFSIIAMNGTFWFPGDKEKAFYGRLTFNKDEGPIVHLHGIFSKEQLAQGVLHGSIEGRPCTLHEVYQVAASVSSGEAGRQHSSRVKAISLFIGAHLDPETVTFPSLNLSLTGLPDWLFHTAFKEVHVEGIEDSVGKFDSYPEAPVQIPGHGLVSFGYNLDMTGPSFTELHWTGDPHISFTPEKPEKLDYFYDKISMFRHLFSLFTDAPVYPSLIRFGQAGNPKGIELLQAIPNAKAEGIRFHQMLLLFPKVQDIWGDVLSKWCQQNKSLNSTIILLAGTVYSSSTVELDFLQLMQSLESFHRAMFNSKYLTDEQYLTRVHEPMVSAIPAGLDQSLKDSMKSKIKYGNEVSLRKRVGELFATLPPELLTLVRFDEGTISVLVNNRNYYTHYSQELEAERVSTMRLLSLGKGVQTVLIYLLLHSAGIPDERFLPTLLEKRKFFFAQDLR